uniref:Integrase catalytic domain-containing protein n=1 Tax=Chenopodium quinoa TaxID=63459 RepID=A0A803N0Y8_CHEQI
MRHLRILRISRRQWKTKVAANIIALRTDRGGEFVSDQFTAFCDEHRIRRDLIAPYTPERTEWGGRAKESNGGRNGQENVVFNKEASFKWNVDKDGIAHYVPLNGEDDEPSESKSIANSTSSSPATTPPSTPSSNAHKSPSSPGSNDSRDTLKLISDLSYVQAEATDVFCDNSTNEQVADIRTKALPRAKHDFFWMQVGVCNFESRGTVE